MLKNTRGFAEILRVNKKKFAAGLFWQPVAVGYTARNYARVLARESHANYFVEYRSMIGLAPRRRGYRAGMPSIAAEVVDALSEYTSFLAVFAVDGKYYLLAVRNSIILADKLFESESDARAEYARFSKIPDWTTFIAPNAWGMPRAMERNLGTILSRKAKYNLRPISRWRSNFVSSILLAVFLVVLYMFFREPINQMKTPKVKPLDSARIEEYKRLVDEKNKELDKQFEIVREASQPLVLPYESLPVPAQRAKQCYQAIGFLMQPVAGWVQSNVVCDETRAVAEFSRKYGSLDEFYKIAADFLPGAEVVELDDNTLSVNVALPEVERVASQDARDAETVERTVISLFQTLRTNVKTDIVVDTIRNGDNTANLNVVEIAASSKLLPMQFIKMFDEFGGVYMTRCVWNAMTRTWNYEVIIYAK